VRVTRSAAAVHERRGEGGEDRRRGRARAVRGHRRGLLGPRQVSAARHDLDRERSDLRPVAAPHDDDRDRVLPGRQPPLVQTAVEGDAVAAGVASHALAADDRARRAGGADHQLDLARPAQPEPDHGPALRLQAARREARPRRTQASRLAFLRERAGAWSRDAALRRRAAGRGSARSRRRRARRCGRSRWKARDRRERRRREPGQRWRRRQGRWRRQWWRWESRRRWGRWQSRWRRRRNRDRGQRGERQRRQQVAARRTSGNHRHRESCGCRKHEQDRSSHLSAKNNAEDADLGTPIQQRRSSSRSGPAAPCRPHHGEVRPTGDRLLLAPAPGSVTRHNPARCPSGSTSSCSAAARPHATPRTPREIMVRAWR
jgi:hypothetical protein